MSFEIKNGGEAPFMAEVIQSAAKWKRLALRNFQFGPGEGLLTDMTAVRSGYFLDHDHSASLSQFDWELVIPRGQRTLAKLKDVVRRIWNGLREAETAARISFPDLVEAMPCPALPEELVFIHAEEVLAKYPTMPRKERENAVCSVCGGGRGGYVD